MFDVKSCVLKPKFQKDTYKIDLLVKKLKQYYEASNGTPQTTCTFEHALS